MHTYEGDALATVTWGRACCSASRGLVLWQKSGAASLTDNPLRTHVPAEQSWKALPEHAHGAASVIVATAQGGEHDACLPHQWVLCWECQA